MDIATLHTTQYSRPERTITDDLQLHTAADRLGDTVCPAQGLHLQCILGCAPGQKAGLERVCGRGDLAGGRVVGGRGVGGSGESDLVTESIGETRR